MQLHPLRLPHLATLDGFGCQTDDKKHTEGRHFGDYQLYYSVDKLCTTKITGE